MVIESLKKIKMHLLNKSRPRVLKFKFTKCSKFILVCFQGLLLKTTVEGVILNSFSFQTNIKTLAIRNESEVFILTETSVILFNFMVGIEIYNIEHSMKNPLDLLLNQEELFLVTIRQIIQITVIENTLKSKLIFEPKLEIKRVKFRNSKLFIQHNNSRKVTIYDLASRAPTVKSFKDKITSIEIMGDLLITGDVRGVVNIELQKKSTTLHWHANPLPAMALTFDQNYLLTGGLESTLVIWQLQTRQKTFLPRLGAKIIDIQVSDCDLYYGLLLADNSVLIISAIDTGKRFMIMNTELQKSIFGLKKSINGYCVNGTESRIQFFDSDLEPLKTVFIVD